MARVAFPGLAAVILLGAPACATQPPLAPAVTSLVMPTPPARTLIPVELPEYVEPEPEPVADETPPSPPARPAPNVRAAERPSAPEPASPTPPPVLQPTNDAPSALAQRVRSRLADAENMLRQVNVLELGAQGKAHYSQARDFIRMANDNLRIRNYVYAEQLANKALTVAGLLTRS